MSYPTDRLLVYDRKGAFAQELQPDQVFSRIRVEQINDEHELTIVTSHVLAEGMRVVTVDGTGKWREYVVYRPDQEHSKGAHAIGTYVCMWSVQYDLMTAYSDEHAEPGMGSSCSAGTAMARALDGQTRWTVGSVDVGSVVAGKGCVMIGVSAWERIKLVVQHWGGEVDAEITMDGTKVSQRAVALRMHLGSTTVKRRFDWGEDLTNIKRIPDEGPYYCRVVPLGRGEREYAEDDETEFDWPTDISEETGGRVYIQDDDAASVFRTKNTDGTWHYPTKVVNYDEGDPELLLNEATADLHNHTRPGVSYEGDVVQFEAAGMSSQGVALGDNTQCADRGFNANAALNIDGRITRMEVDELAPNERTTLTIGSLGTNLAQALTDLIGARTASITNRVNNITSGGTLLYLESLVAELNNAINATGGYSYLVPGEGIITYDIAVDDPLVGYNSQSQAYATQVVQIKGGSIRIANEKNASFAGINDWKWKTVIVSGHVAANLVTAANLTAGYIGNASGSNYWDLDNDEVRMLANSMSIVDDQTTYTGAQVVRMAQSGAAAGETASQALAEASKEIGGTNILLDSNNNAMTKYAATADRYWNTSSGVTTSMVTLSASSQPTNGASYAAQISFSTNSSSKYGGVTYYSGKSVPMIDGQTYTISCWAKIYSGSNAEVYFQYGQTSFIASSKMVITNKWRRYSWTFTFTQSRVGGSSGARVTFFAKPRTSYAVSVQIAGMKLEVGGRATDWSPAPEDINHSVSKSKADAETYTNEISTADRQYTASQRSQLDASFNQEKVFKRLTNNSTAQGLVLKNGKLYINGEYIQTKTLKADIIKTGILSDAKGVSKWNMVTGYLETKNGVFKNANVDGQFSCGGTYKIELKSGQVRGYKSGKLIATIDTTATLQDKKTKKKYPGLNIVSNGGLRIMSPLVSTLNSSNNRATAIYGFSGTVTLKNLTYNMANNMKRCKQGSVTFKFINGLFVGIPSGTTGLVYESSSSSAFTSASTETMR